MTASSRSRLNYSWLISASTLAADQLSKLAVLRTFQPDESIPVIHPALYLTYVQNTGAAFGLLKGQQWLFVGLSLVVIAWVGQELWSARSNSRMTRWGCALILGGAAGNLIDRLRFGHVVDFIDLRVWPVFNIGDSAITVGVFLILLTQFRHFRRSV